MLRHGDDRQDADLHALHDHAVRGLDATLGAASSRSASSPPALPALASRLPATLHVSLSGDGKQTTDFGGADLASAVALQADGKICWSRLPTTTSRSPATVPTARLPPASSAMAWMTTDLVARTMGRRGDRGRRQDRRRGQFGGGNFGDDRSPPAAGSTVVQRRRPADDRLRRRRRRDAVAIEGDGWIVVGGGSGGSFGRHVTTLRVNSIRRSAAMASRPPASVGSTPATTWRSAPTGRLSPWASSRSSIAVRGTSPCPLFLRRCAHRSVDHASAERNFAYDSAEGVTIEADGRIVVVGYSAEQTRVRWLLLRRARSCARYDPAAGCQALRRGRPLATRL